MTKYRVTIEHDTDVDDPSKDDGQWTIHSFNSRHSNFKQPTEFTGEDGKILPSLNRKLRSGLAHILAYYEHGGCMWSTDGSAYPFTDHFDAVQFAGIAIWEHRPCDLGAKTVEDRRKDCESFLEAYNDWCNGNCYGYTIEKIEECPHCHGDMVEEPVDSCWGFIGDDAVEEAVASALPDDADEDNTEFVSDVFQMDWNDIERVRKQVNA